MTQKRRKKKASDKSVVDLFKHMNLPTAEPASPPSYPIFLDPFQQQQAGFQYRQVLTNGTGRISS